eukprot:1187391-Prorocentrum_minimum.AAC.1
MTDFVSLTAVPRRSPARTTFSRGLGAASGCGLIGAQRHLADLVSWQIKCGGGGGCSRRPSIPVTTSGYLTLPRTN